MEVRTGPERPTDPVVRRAVEFTDRHALDGITVVQMAAAAGVGLRALQAAFRRHLDLTPREYLQRVRLEGAHRDLLVADPARGATVAGTARRWGFLNPGRFSGDYRRRFARWPSATLRERATSDPSTPGATDGTVRLLAAHRPASAVQVALLDTAGVIVWVNHVWTDFALAHGGDPDRTGVGCSYLAVSDAAAADDPASATVSANIREALRGALPVPAHLALPCPTPQRPLVVDVLVSTRRDDDGRILGATITLSEAEGA